LQKKIYKRVKKLFIDSNEYLYIIKLQALAKFVYIAKRGLNDLYYFTKFILGYNQIAVQPHKEWSKQIVPNQRRILFLAPRGHLKTTLITIGYVLQRIIKNRDLRVLLIHAIGKNAKNYLRAIKGHIKGNLLFRACYGNLDELADKWTENTIIISRRRAELKEPTIEAVGIGQEIVSEHADLIILDDPVSFGNSRTPTERQKVIDFFLSLPDILEPGGQLIIIGTRWHLFDLYGYIIKHNKSRFKDYQIVVEKAIIKEGKKERALFPSKFPLQFLKALKREKGSIKFNLQYLNDVAALKEKMFKEKWFRFYNDEDMDKIVTLPDGRKIRFQESLRVFQGVDPATESTDGSAFAHSTIGKDMDGNRYLLDYYRGFIGLDRQIKLIKEKNDRFKPTIVGIEGNAYQKVLANFFIDRTDIPVKSIFHNLDPESRAMKLQPTIENKKFFIRSSMNYVVEEFTSFPGQYNDVIDSILLADEVSSDNLNFSGIDDWD